MPFPSDHMLFQWHGVFANVGGQVVDEFVGSMRFAGGDFGLIDNDDVGLELLTALQAWWKAPANFISTFAILGSAKWNRVGPDGRYKNQSQTRIVYTPQNTPGGGGTGYPLQVAWATTWLTDKQRGKASQGRTFWPTSVPVVAGDNLRVGREKCKAFAVSSLALVTTLNGIVEEPQGNLTRAVIGSDVGAGTWGYIQDARVGNRLDIQRRRDNKLPEVYERAKA